MKKAVAMLCCISCMLLFISCNSAIVDVLNNHARSVHKDSPGEIELSFQYTKQDKTDSNQFAAWLENDKGEIVYTFAVTKYTVKKGYKKSPGSLATWVSKANPKDMKKEEIDAIAQATPDTGTVVCTWDCVDDKGAVLAPGKYVIYLEGSSSAEDGIIYIGSLVIGDESSKSYLIPGFKTEESKSDNMILNVIAKFTPKEGN
jgi:hypothetical protein